MPPDSVPIRRANRFQYHPLLQAVPIAYFKSTSGVNVRHNLLGHRNPEYSSKELQDSRIINVYGGSSTYDIALPNGSTWVDYLQRGLGEHYKVMNFGVPGYSTAEHIIQTAFYADIYGRSPDCSLYYIGWNDIRNAHMPGLDNGYADFDLPSQVDNLQVRKEAPLSTPLFKAFYVLGHKLFDVMPPARNINLPPQSGTDYALEKVFIKNIRNIVMLNRAQFTKTVFIGQTLNKTWLQQREETSLWIPLVRGKDVWQLQERFNDILKNESQNLGTMYIDVGEFSSDHFVDEGHFSVKGAEIFAQRILNAVRNDCD